MYKSNKSRTTSMMGGGNVKRPYNPPSNDKNEDSEEEEAQAQKVQQIQQIKNPKIVRKYQK
jgi:hypothetical protein